MIPVEDECAFPTYAFVAAETSNNSTFRRRFIEMRVFCTPATELWWNKYIWTKRRSLVYTLDLNVVNVMPADGLERLGAR